MSEASLIDPATIRAYVETEYRVHGAKPFVLRVGTRNSFLQQAHTLRGVDCSAYITACNPFSEPADIASNAVRQAKLAGELTRRALAFLPGLGQHPTNGWPGEESFLVFGLDLEAAKALATRFEQNGFVWSGADALPQLVLLR